MTRTKAKAVPKDPAAGGRSAPARRAVQAETSPAGTIAIERVQTGVRLEKRLLKVLKALAEYHDLSLGDLLEGIVLHAFDGKSPFDAAAQARIRELKRIYHLDLDARASHRLRESQE